MQTCKREGSLVFFFLHCLDSRLHFMLQVAVAGNLEQQVNLLTPMPGGLKYPPPHWGPPLLLGPWPWYNTLPLIKLTASLHHTSPACWAERADACQMPSTEAYLSDGRRTSPATALPAPPPKWRRTASAGTRRGEREKNYISQEPPRPGAMRLARARAQSAGRRWAAVPQVLAGGG